MGTPFLGLPIYFFSVRLYPKIARNPNSIRTPVNGTVAVTNGLTNGHVNHVFADDKVESIKEQSPPQLRKKKFAPTPPSPESPELNQALKALDDVLSSDSVNTRPVSGDSGFNGDACEENVVALVHRADSVKKQKISVEEIFLFDKLESENAIEKEESATQKSAQSENKVSDENVIIVDKTEQTKESLPSSPVKVVAEKKTKAKAPSPPPVQIANESAPPSPPLTVLAEIEQEAPPPPPLPPANLPPKSEPVHHVPVPPPLPGNSVNDKEPIPPPPPLPVNFLNAKEPIPSPPPLPVSSLNNKEPIPPPPPLPLANLRKAATVSSVSPALQREIKEFEKVALKPINPVDSIAPFKDIEEPPPDNHLQFGSKQHENFKRKLEGVFQQNPIPERPSFRRAITVHGDNFMRSEGAQKLKNSFRNDPNQLKPVYQTTDTNRNTASFVDVKSKFERTLNINPNKLEHSRRMASTLQSIRLRRVRGMLPE